MLNQSVTLSDLDRGVQECIRAKTVCRGLEINQKPGEEAPQRQLLAGLPGLQARDAHRGLPLQRLVLLKDDMVVYKLTGGQPVIREQEENQNPLGPVQSIGNKFLGGWLSS